MATIGHQALTTDNTALILIDHEVGTMGWAGELVGDEAEPFNAEGVYGAFAKGNLR